MHLPGPERAQCAVQEEGSRWRQVNWREVNGRRPARPRLGSGHLSSLVSRWLDVSSKHEKEKSWSQMKKHIRPADNVAKTHTM